MKKLLLKEATIVQQNSSEIADVFIIDGKIASVGNVDQSGEDVEIIPARGKYLVPGFFDLNANFGEPGYETREDIGTGTNAAASGGFTGVAVHPNTYPPIHSKAEVSYLVSQASNQIVDVYPVGCISHNREGKDLAELFDMSRAGAIAFSDGDRPVSDSGLMSRALLYAKGFNGLVFSNPEDISIAGKGKMNEGIASTFLGMKGIPSLAEEIMISRDLYLAEYNDSPIHFSTISSAGSVGLIRAAKSRGIKVSCDVAAHHLVLTEEILSSFDSNYKVKPPLRTGDDRTALLKGLEDGTIDAIVSQHSPFEVEYKNVEFEIASFGIIGLQTVLPLALRAGLSVAHIVEKLSINPRRILGLSIPAIKVGETANVVLLDTNLSWTLNADTNKSKSANTPFFGEDLVGKVVFAANNNLSMKF